MLKKNDVVVGNLYRNCRPDSAGEELLILATIGIFTDSSVQSGYEVAVIEQSCHNIPVRLLEKGKRYAVPDWFIYQYFELVP